MNIDMIEVQRMLQSHGILISFAGKLSQELIVEYGEAVKSYLKANDHTQNEIFKIFSFFIEQTQNINNYCASKAANVDYEVIALSSIVTIGKSGGENYVSSGNLIESKDIKALETHLELINRLDKHELKALYKAT